jgi:carbamoyltransferase
VVDEKTNPKYYALLKEMEKLTGDGAVLNTSMNRRGEPMVCSPKDALNMFFGSDLKYLFLENLLVTKAE